MGSSRNAERVATLVAAVSIGFVISGPTVAYADPDTRGTHSDSSNDAQSSRSSGERIPARAQTFRLGHTGAAIRRFLRRFGRAQTRVARVGRYRQRHRGTTGSTDGTTDGSTDGSTAAAPPAAPTAPPAAAPGSTGGTTDGTTAATTDGTDAAPTAHRRSTGGTDGTRRHHGPTAPTRPPTGTPTAPTADTTDGTRRHPAVAARFAHPLRACSERSPTPAE